MGDVALTEIRYGDEDGKVTTIAQGDEVKGLPKDVVESLKAGGSIGSPETLAVNLGSTASILQREDSESLTNVPPGAPAASESPSEDDVAKALADATDQMARGENQAKTSKATTEK